MRRLALLIAVALLVAPARADEESDFRRGLSAYNTGDYATAYQLWLPLAEKSEPRAEAGVGFMLFRGLGVALDDAAAAKWLTRAAEHGQAEGQLMLGLLYYYGRGVERSYVRSFAWCDLATTNGSADASLCRDASQEAMSAADHDEAFRLVVARGAETRPQTEKSCRDLY
jgi:TPR repeat protein